MRAAFCQALIEMARRDERVWLLSGDLGFSVLEPFAKEFPGRFVNCGVAEQNMTGVAAGLALAGKIVFTYSIANFPVMRCLEQIRNDICYHNLNVRIVSVGGGLAYGSLGYSHFGLEDLAVMRVMPNMTTIAPGDPVEVRLVMESLRNYSGPIYLRLGKGRERVIHKESPEFFIGKAILVRNGQSLTLISTGGILDEVVLAADILARHGVQARVLSMPTLQPLDENAILQAAKETGGLVSIEEHGAGGLFSAVAETLSRYNCRASLRGINISGISDQISSTVGDQQVLRTRFGLDAQSIAAACLADCRSAEIVP
jgi:transketolase